MKGRLRSSNSSIERFFFWSEIWITKIHCCLCNIHFKMVQELLTNKFYPKKVYISNYFRYLGSTLYLDSKLIGQLIPIQKRFTLWIFIHSCCFQVDDYKNQVKWTRKQESVFEGKLTIRTQINALQYHKRKTGKHDRRKKLITSNTYDWINLFMKNEKVKRQNQYY